MRTIVRGWRFRLARTCCFEVGVSLCRGYRFAGVEVLCGWFGIHVTKERA